MTPALWAELVGAIVTISGALAAYLKANTAQKSADNATQAVNAHVMTHVINRSLERANTMSVPDDTIVPTAPAMTSPGDPAPELTDPIGRQGASLMGLSGQPPQTDPLEPENAPEPTAPPVPDPVVLNPNTVDTEPPPPVKTAESVLDRIIEGLTELRGLL